MPSEVDILARWPLELVCRIISREAIEFAGTHFGRHRTCPQVERILDDSSTNADLKELKYTESSFRWALNGSFRFGPHVGSCRAVRTFNADPWAREQTSYGCHCSLPPLEMTSLCEHPTRVPVSNTPNAFSCMSQGRTTMRLHSSSNKRLFKVAIICCCLSAIFNRSG